MHDDTQTPVHLAPLSGRLRARAARAERAQRAAPEIAALARSPRFAVYRNTVMKGCIDALQANYPAVARLVGEEWFRAAAAIYVRERCPREPTLLRYGAAFAEFLARFEPAAELPYLPGVARLDRFWTESHAAPDEEALDPGRRRRAWRPKRWRHGPAPASPRRAGPGLPMRRSIPSGRATAPSAAPTMRELDWQGEGRAARAPARCRRVDRARRRRLRLSRRLRRGRPLAEAAQRGARSVQGDADLAQLMTTLLAAGAFGRMSSSATDPQED